jgi:hydrogenase nickel incorporation protein HypA/HybF
MSIAKSLLDIVTGEASKHNIEKVVRIHIRAGELRGIVPEHLNYFFQFVSKDTLAEGAELEVEILPVKAECKACEMTFRVENFNYQCPRCRSEDVDTVQGLELMVQDFEVC